MVSKEEQKHLEQLAMEQRMKEMEVNDDAASSSSSEEGEKEPARWRPTGDERIKPILPKRGLVYSELLPYRPYKAEFENIPIDTEMFHADSIDREKHLAEFHRLQDAYVEKWGKHFGFPPDQEADAPAPPPETEATPETTDDQ